MLACGMPAGIKFFQKADVVDPDDESKIYQFHLDDPHHCACFNIGVQTKLLNQVTCTVYKVSMLLQLIRAFCGANKSWPAHA